MNKKVRLGASEGKLEIVTGMYLLVFLATILTAQMQSQFFTMTHIFMEDALAASNLASAVIDVREYGISHTVKIASPQAAYELYKEALRENLQLDDRWEYWNKRLIGGPVEILQYTIYNVEKENVIVHSFDRMGNYSTWEVPEGLGSLCAPDGTMIESTSVYSRIGFPVEGILGICVFADQDNTVDIVGNGMGEVDK